MTEMILARREFCVRACRAVSVVALGSALPGCGGSPTSPSSVPALPMINASVVNGTITLTIDSSSPLASVGGASLVSTSSGNFLVARTAQNNFTALTAVCTHQGCTVSGFQNQTYVCPCHGSEYNLSGAVVMGPAASPLHQFATSFSNNILTITGV